MRYYDYLIYGFIFMVLDHIRHIIPGDNILLFALGRLALPFFVYGIVVGFYYSRDLNNYLVRLFLLAIVSQVPYLLFFDYFSLNIIFSLFYGLCLISLLYYKQFLICSIFIFSIIFLPISYFTIVSILLLYLFYYDKKSLLFSQFFNVALYSFLVGDFIYLFYFLPWPFILYNKYFFLNFSFGRLLYFVYPIHFIVLFLIKRFLIYA